MPRPQLLAAVDFGGTKVALATATLDGEIVDETRFGIDAGRGAKHAVARALGAARSSIARAEAATGGACVAAGVVCPGVVREDGIALAPNVPGWEQLALRPLVQDGLGLERVRVGNDVKAAAVAEARWGTLAGADPALFLNLGTGLAAAVLAGGRVIGGAHGAAGEIGYSLRGVAEPGAFADGHAPLEEVAGGRFLGVRASRLTGRDMTAAEAFAAADGPTRELVDQALDELAVHVANMALLLDPKRIATAGGMMRSGARVLAALERRLRRAVPFPPELVRARFVQDAALPGAVALARDAVLPDAVATGDRP
jgi:glucokinase